MTAPLLRVAAVGAPAMLGVLSAMAGRKSGQALRERTGDDSTLAGVLSAAFLRTRS